MTPSMGAILISFLSTLSLRRATMIHLRSCNVKSNFYPRSPCGERQFSRRLIHHLSKFLSTLSLRRATALGLLGWLRVLISIHALLAESDYDTSSLMQCQVKFLSTLSLRRATLKPHKHSGRQHDFYPRSPCGERRYIARH